MIVRGAPAIAATAAYAWPRRTRLSGVRPAKIFRHIETVYQTLKAARPTAVIRQRHERRPRRDARRPDRGGTAIARARAPRNLPMKTCGIARPSAARRQVDPQRHEHLTHCNAGGWPLWTIGTATRHVCRASAGQKISRLLR